MLQIKLKLISETSKVDRFTFGLIEAGFTTLVPVADQGCQQGDFPETSNYTQEKKTIKNLKMLVLRTFRGTFEDLNVIF